MRYASCAVILVGLTALGCGGGSTENDIARLEGTWRGAYTAPGGPAEINMSIDGDGNVTNFEQLGTLIAPTTGTILRTGTATYTASLVSGLTIAMVLSESGNAMALRYVVAAIAYAGLLERGGPPFPPGGFLNGDLFGRSFSGHGGRFSDALILAVLLVATASLDGSGVFGGTLGANAFSSGAQMAMQDNVNLGIWRVGLEGFTPGPGNATILMTPSKGYIGLFPCEIEPDPPLDRCWAAILKAD